MPGIIRIRSTQRTKNYQTVKHNKLCMYFLHKENLISNFANHRKCTYKRCFIHSWMTNYEAINYYYRVKLRYLNVMIVYSHECNVTCLQYISKLSPRIGKLQEYKPDSNEHLTVYYCWHFPTFFLLNLIKLYIFNNRCLSKNGASGLLHKGTKFLS